MSAYGRRQRTAPVVIAVVQGELIAVVVVAVVIVVLGIVTTVVSMPTVISMPAVVTMTVAVARVAMAVVVNTTGLAAVTVSVAVRLVHSALVTVGLVHATLVAVRLGGASRTSAFFAVLDCGRCYGGAAVGLGDLVHIAHTADGPVTGTDG